MGWFKTSEFGTVLVSIIVVIFLADYYLVIGPLNSGADIMYEALSYYATLALVVGSVMFWRRHVRGVIRSSSVIGKYYSALSLVEYVIMFSMVMGLGFTHPTTSWWYRVLYFPMEMSVNVLVGFFFIAMIYRAFRPRTKEGLFTIGAATVTLLANFPILNSALPFLGTISFNAYIVFAAGTLRGIMLGIVVFTVATVVRMVLRKERGVVL
jgi:hypothetical protein